VNVKATFSENMKPASINKTSFTLRKRGTTTKVAGTISYDPTTDTATLDLTISLKKGDTYKAAVNIGAEDLAGNRLDQNESLNGSQVHKGTFKVKN
jgi:hypothetical protein